MKLVSGKIKVVASLVMAVLALGGTCFGLLLRAHAATNMVYSVKSTAAAGGVYTRYGPHTNDTNSIDGFGVYPGQSVKLLCGVTDGSPVGENNTIPGQLAVAGEPVCPNESSNQFAQAPGHQWVNYLQIYCSLMYF